MIRRRRLTWIENWLCWVAALIAALVTYMIAPRFVPAAAVSAAVVFCFYGYAIERRWIWFVYAVALAALVYAALPPRSV
jgi:hypothetical protein